MDGSAAETWPIAGLVRFVTQYAATGEIIVDIPQVSLYLRDRMPCACASVPPGAGELKILIACYDGTDRTDRHIPDRRAPPRQVRGAGRLFFRTGSDPLPRAGRGGVFHRALRVASASAGRRGPGRFREAARSVPRLYRCRRSESQGDRTNDQPRRKGRRVFGQGEARRAGTRRSPRVRALRPDVAGHQQHGDSVEPARCVERRLLSAARATDGQADRVVERMGGSSAAGPHARAAGLADEARQGDPRVRRADREADRAAARDSVARQVRRSDRQLQCACVRVSRCRLGRVREPFRQRRAGTRPLADHDADRALRQHRRYFR